MATRAQRSRDGKIISAEAVGSVSLSGKVTGGEVTELSLGDGGGGVGWKNGKLEREQ